MYDSPYLAFRSQYSKKIMLLFRKFTGTKAGCVIRLNKNNNLLQTEFEKRNIKQIFYSHRWRNFVFKILVKKDKINLINKTVLLNFFTSLLWQFYNLKLLLFAITKRTAKMWINGNNCDVLSNYCEMTD